MSYPKGIERIRALEEKFPITAADLDPSLGGTVASSVPNVRSISTTAPLQGGGNLTANRTLSIKAAAAATATADGTAGSVVYAKDTDKTSRNKAATPAGVNRQVTDAIENALGSGTAPILRLLPVENEHWDPNNTNSNLLRSFIRTPDEDGKWAVWGGYNYIHYEARGDTGFYDQTIIFVPIAKYNINGNTEIASQQQNNPGGGRAPAITASYLFAMRIS